MRMLKFFGLLMCIALPAIAQDAAKYREYMDAAARVEKFSGTVLAQKQRDWGTDTRHTEASPHSA